MTHSLFQDAKAKFLVYAGILLALIALTGYLLEIEPFHNLFYIFAWWAYIFLLDATIYYMKGESLIISRTKEFWFLLPWSVFIWFLFELANLRLQNWSYMFIPADRQLRWTGYFLAYATVLPGLFETTELLSSLRVFRNTFIKPLRITPALLKKISAAGAAALLLPLLLPRYFFALIWITFTLLLEPVNYRLGLPSLLRDLEHGDPRKLFWLLGGGFICGLLWEFWNSLAGAKWIYTVPLVGDIKLFEMPVAGYIGFPVFAVECYVMYNFISYLRSGRSWEENQQEPIPGLTPSPLILLGAAALLLIVCYLTPGLIDTHTVRLYIAY